MQRSRTQPNKPRKLTTDQDFEREGKFQRNTNPRRGPSGTPRGTDASSPTTRTVPKSPRTNAPRQNLPRRPSHRAS
jgi:hypothetical protein